MNKRILGYLALALLVLVPVTAKASLWSFFEEQGVDFIACNQERHELAAEYAVWDYDCSAEKNEILEARMRDNLSRSEESIGASVATGYKTTLQSSMTSSQATVPVSSITLPTGETLTMANLSNKVFLVVEPGSSRQEIVVCTTISSSQFAGCTRGLAFSGTSESAVSGYNKAHRAGSVVVMSNTHYVFEQLVDKDSTSSETLEGSYTFTSTTAVNFWSYPYVSSTAFTTLPTLDGHLSTKYYVDNVGAGGFTSVNASSTKGLEVYGTAPETVGVNVSTTVGYAFSSDGSIYRKLQTSTGIETDSNGLKINTSTLDLLIASSTPVADFIVKTDSTSKIDNTFIETRQLSTITVKSGATINGATLPVPVYRSSTDSEVYAVAGNVSTTAKFIGFAITNSTDGNDITVQTKGVVSGFTGLTTSSEYYVQNTAGTIGATPGTNRIFIGIAVSNSEILLTQPKVHIWLRQSDTLQISMDTTDSLPATTPAEQKAVMFYKTGMVKTKFTLKNIPGSGDVFGQIYRNGVAYGTLQTVTGSNTTEFEQDLFFSAGDRISLYGYYTGSGTKQIYNFRIYYDEGVIYEDYEVTNS